MTALHYYAVAATFGTPPDKLEAVSGGVWLASNPESAAAGYVSKYYFDGGPRHHACLGVSLWEITPEMMTIAQQQIAEAATAGASGVVPFSVVPPAPPEPSPVCEHHWQDGLWQNAPSRVCVRCGKSEPIAAQDEPA